MWCWFRRWSKTRKAESYTDCRPRTSSWKTMACEQPVRLDDAPEGQPISLVVAIQRGRRASYEFPRMQGLKSMLDPLFSLGTARVAVVEFDSQVDLIRNFTNDATLVRDDLKDLQPGDGGAVILDAVDYCE